VKKKFPRIAWETAIRENMADDKPYLRKPDQMQGCE